MFEYFIRNFSVELVGIENNKVTYRGKKKMITVIREYSKDTDINFSTVIDALMKIIEQEENDEDNTNE